MIGYSLHNISEWIRSKGFSKVIILTDFNTSEHCLPVFKKDLDINFEEISIATGESSKNLEQAGRIWERMLQLDADRNAVLLNLGGGMITDIGGFCAATYKRGIPFINVPTTLLGMVDAAIGGKTGINLGHYKNQVGLFADADAIFIEPLFLRTLPERELKSGFAEVLKYGLIQGAGVRRHTSRFDREESGVRSHTSRFDREASDDKTGFGRELWDGLQAIEPGKTEEWMMTIINCASIKERIAHEDPIEAGLRKILNFGHTIGHGIESYSLENDADPLLHGEAIAIGMIAEGFLSSKKTGLSPDDLDGITGTIRKIFGKYSFSQNAFPKILEYILKDKKNTGNEVRCVLLEKIGKALYDIPVSAKEIEDALDYYRNLNHPNP